MTTPLLKTAPVGDPARGQRDGSLLSASAKRTATATSTRRRAWPKALRVARDLILGLALIAAVPLTTIGISDHTWGWNSQGVRPRLVEVERLRSVTIPVDAAISPEEAGTAMRRLLPPATTPASSLPMDWLYQAAEWKAAPPADVYTMLRNGTWSGPDPSRIVYAAAQGLSEHERGWLKLFAESPIWKDFDMVARAQRVDMLAQRFKVPLSESEWPGAMPIPSFTEGRILAMAGVARAAHYMSIGDTARAEYLLRSVVSFGFAMLDDGITTTEALMGRAVIDIGREGLSQLYRLDYRRMDEWNLVEQFASRVSTLGLRRAESVSALQAAALRNVGDEKLPRSFRFDQLATLALSTCGSVRSVVLGPPPAVQQAFNAARRSLAHSEAEREYIDLLERNGSAMPVRSMQWSLAFQVVQGAGVVTSTVLNNPRIASCTRAVIGDFASPQDK